MAQGNENEIIIEIGIKTDEVQKELAEAIKNVADLKDKQKELTATIEEGNDANGENAKKLAEVQKQLEQNKRTIKSHTAMLQAENETIDTENMSLDEQRQKLNALQKAYSMLSGEQRKAADIDGGLRDKIKQLTESVKAQEHAIGDDRRNVGNYAESIKKVTGDLGPLKTAMEGFFGAGNAAAKGIDAVDKSAKILNVNPFFMTVWAIVAVGGTILNLLKKNEKAMGEMQVMTDGFGNLLEELKPIFQWILDWLAKWFIAAIEKAIEWVKTALGWVEKLANKFGKDLHLTTAFEAGAAAADKATESTEKLGKALETAAEKAKRLHDEAFKAWLVEEQWREDSAAAIEALNRQSETARKAALKALEEQRKAIETLDASLIEEEEGDPVESVEAMCRRMFGLDSAGIEYFQKLLDEGVGAHEAAQLAIQDQVKRSKEAMTASFGDLGNAMQGLSDAVGKFAESNKAASVAQKTLAAGAIAVNQALSIAEGAKAIAAAMAGAAEAAAATGPAAPFTLIAYQAQMVGQVLAMTATVASTISQAKQILSSAKDAGKYATGGIVGGNSYSGDRMIAHVNSGEAIITREGQARLLELANGSRQSSYESTMSAMRSAMAAMPAPVLTYKEFKEFETETVQIQEIAKV